MGKQRVWIRQSVSIGKLKSQVTHSDGDKEEIRALCQPLVEQFKKEYISQNPDKQFNYLIDVYTRWHGNYLYFCEKLKSSGPNSIGGEFEIKFVRLEYTGKDSFNFSYLRHTGQWFLVDTDLSLKDCLKMMVENPVFQPIG